MKERKFISLGELLAARGRFSALVKAVCERLSICRRSERDSIEPRRERLLPPIRKPDAENQPGSHFGRFDRADNIAHFLGFFVAAQGRVAARFHFPPVRKHPVFVGLKRDFVSVQWSDRRQRNRRRGRGQGGTALSTA
jgi:hypothetical protein